MNRASLLTALEMVKPGIDDKDKTNLGQDKCFFNEDTVSAFNNELAITYPIHSGVTALVRAMDLISLLKKMHKISNEVSLSSDGTSLEVTTVDSRTSIPVSSDTDVENRLTAIQEAVNAKDMKWFDLPGNFQDCALICSLAASKRESQFTLACIYLDGLNALASDNDKVTWAILDKPIKKMLIKATAVKHIIAINPTQYSGDKSYFHFKNEDDAIISVRRVVGEYPVEYMGMFDFTGTVFSIPKKAIDGIGMLSVFIDDKAPAIKVDVQKGRCVMSSGASRGASKFKVDIQYNGEPFSFMIGPDVLGEMLKHSTDITVGDNIAKIVSDDETFKMITTLILE